MWEIWRLLYNLFIVPVVNLSATILALFLSRVRSGLAARRGWRSRLVEVLRALGGRRLLIWFHCASLGEYEQTRPILDELRRRHGDRLSIILSFFSQTGLKHGRYRGLADYAFLLPLDSPATSKRLLDLIKPNLLCFVKFDLWPELAWSAREAGVPVALVSASAHPRSSITHPLLRGFFRAVFRSCSFIGAVDAEDARRLEIVSAKRVEITGDSKYDAVISRRDSAGEAPVHLKQTGPVLVCGSTHPPDEEELLPILAGLLTELEGLSVILAPHHVDEGHLEGIESGLDTLGIKVERLSALREMGRGPKGRLVLVDTVGCLFELYSLASVAYVGGGFWDRGLHNVLEPAVFGAALVYGPRIHNSIEARRLDEMEIAERVEDFSELKTALHRFLTNPAEARNRGVAARRFCEQRAGAAARIVDRLESLCGLSVNDSPGGLRG